MPAKTINWSQITYVVHFGQVMNRVQRSNGTRMWERVWVPQTSQVETGGYWAYQEGYWEVQGGTRVATSTGLWNVGAPTSEWWPDGEPGPDYSWTGINQGPDLGYGPTWIFTRYETVGATEVYIPGYEYWVPTYSTVDTSYWAYYY
jgi:hypothetical protein